VNKVIHYTPPIYLSEFVSV